jgi:hypothetical protein
MYIRIVSKKKQGKEINCLIFNYKIVIYIRLLERKEIKK